MFEMSEKLIELVRQNEVLYNTKCREYKDHVKRAAAWDIIAMNLNSNVNEVKERWKKLRNAYASALKRRKTKSGQGAEQIIPWKYEEQMNFLRLYMETRPTISNLELPPAYSSETNTQYLTQRTLSPFPMMPRTPSPTDRSPSEPLPLLTPSPVHFTQRPSSPAPMSSTQNSENSRPRPISSKPTKRPQKKCDDRFDNLYSLMKSSQEIKAKKMRLQEEMDETDLFFLSMSRSVKKLELYDQAKIKFNLHKAIHEAELNNILETSSSLQYHQGTTSVSPPVLNF